MALIDEDTETNPSVTTAQYQYIIHLKDTHKQFTRFFDALLIPRPSHGAFFRDLKAFRSQTTIISILEQCNAEDTSVSKDEIREKYRQVTQSFLQSRFAHPWCRKAMAGTGSSKGWWGAEWSATGRKMSQDAKEQEEKLHKLIVPIWIIFRGRMFPGEKTVEEWHQQRLAAEEQEKTRSELGLEEGVKNWLGGLDSEIDDSREGSHRDIQRMTSSTQGSHVSKKINAPKSHTNSRQDPWDSDEAAEMDEEFQQQEKQAAQAATSVFRLAAAGMIVSSMPKRKLRNLIRGK